MPPFTPSTCPVMYVLRSLARKSAALATSSGLPPRLSGICSTQALRMSSLTAFVMSVSMKPGAMQFTRTPRLPVSFARLLLNAISPPLLAA